MAKVILTVISTQPNLSASWDIPDQHQSELKKFLDQHANALDGACDEFCHERLPEEIAALKREPLE